MRNLQYLLVLALVALATGCSGGGVANLASISPQETTFSWPEGDDPAAPIPVDHVITIRNSAAAASAGDEVVVFLPEAGAVPEFDYEIRDAQTGAEQPVLGTARKHVILDGGDAIELRLFAKTCFDVEDFPLVLELARHVNRDGDGNIAGPSAERPDPTLDINTVTAESIRVTNVADEPPDPDPDPDPGLVDSIESELSVVRGIEAIEDENGDPKIMLIGETAAGTGGTEIWDFVSGVLEHTLPTVDGRAGQAGYTPDGKLIFTVIIDDASGFVRGDVFDASSDSLYINSDFNASQWLTGANKLPHRPVRLRDWIFTAPGALGEYEILATLPGPTLDGDPTVQPRIPYDLVGSGRKPIRAITVSTIYSEVLTLNRHDADADTVISRRESAPGDNPANFFAPIGTIAGTPNRFLAFGDVGLAWEFGGLEGSLLKRGGDGELNGFDRVTAMKADMIRGIALSKGLGGVSRAAFLRPDCIDELSVPASGAPTWRSIPLEEGAPAAELVAVTRNGLTRLCVLREGETEIDIFDLD